MPIVIFKYFSSCIYTVVIWGYNADVYFLFWVVDINKNQLGVTSNLVCNAWYIFFQYQLPLRPEGWYSINHNLFFRFQLWLEVSFNSRLRNNLLKFLHQMQHNLIIYWCNSLHLAADIEHEVIILRNTLQHTDSLCLPEKLVVVVMETQMLRGYTHMHFPLLHYLLCSQWYSAE